LNLKVNVQTLDIALCAQLVTRSTFTIVEVVADCYVLCVQAAHFAAIHCLHYQILDLTLGLLYSP